jgi:hypothetical protein
LTTTRSLGDASITTAGNQTESHTQTGEPVPVLIEGPSGTVQELSLEGQRISMRPVEPAAMVIYLLFFGLAFPKTIIGQE